MTFSSELTRLRFLIAKGDLPAITNALQILSPGYRRAIVESAAVFAFYNSSNVEITKLLAREAGLKLTC